MRLLALLLPALLAMLLMGGCRAKTPEEIEAAKYPKVEPNPPEVSREIQQTLQRRQEGGL